MGKNNLVYSVEEFDEEQVNKMYCSTLRRYLSKGWSSFFYRDYELETVIMLGIYESLQKYDPAYSDRMSVNSWVYSGVELAVYKYVRSLMTHRKYHVEIPAKYEQFVTNGINNVDKTSDKIDASILLEIVNNSNDVDAKVLKLSMDGYSYREIGEMLGVSGQRVGGRFLRAITRLKNRFSEQEQDRVQLSRRYQKEICETIMANMPKLNSSEGDMLKYITNSSLFSGELLVKTPIKDVTRIFNVDTNSAWVNFKSLVDKLSKELFYRAVTPMSFRMLSDPKVCDDYYSCVVSHEYFVYARTYIET